MPEATDRTEMVYGVRPEPPHFDELDRRPDPVDPYSFALHPPGQIRRWVGARRAQILFRIGLVVVLAVVVTAFVR